MNESPRNRFLRCRFKRGYSIRITVSLFRFYGCTTNKSRSWRAYAINATFNGANLYRANLNGALLQEADLSKADLRGADFTDALLIGTNFWFSDLRGARNLQGSKELKCANFYKTRVTPEERRIIEEALRDRISLVVESAEDAKRTL